MPSSRWSSRKINRQSSSARILLRSGLALAGANARRSGTDDDGILTAFEAAQIDLRALRS
jgi:hypothetical protein